VDAFGEPNIVSLLARICPIITPLIVWTVFVKYYKERGIRAKVGYTGGKASTPNYRQVCSGDTGHAESVRIEFDPSKIAYAELVEFFYRTHDPTTLNRQGADRGTRKLGLISLLALQCLVSQVLRRNYAIQPRVSIGHLLSYP
jgi:hypothetical protein